MTNFFIQYYTDSKIRISIKKVAGVILVLIYWGLWQLGENQDILSERPATISLYVTVQDIDNDLRALKIKIPIIPNQMDVGGSLGLSQTNGKVYFLSFFPVEICNNWLFIQCIGSVRVWVGGWGQSYPFFIVFFIFTKPLSGLLESEFMLH